VLAGSLVGVRILVKAETKILRLVFAVVIAFLGLQMLYNGIAGRIYAPLARVFADRPRWANDVRRRT